MEREPSADVRTGAEVRHHPVTAKSGIGTALRSASRVWFSLARGIVEEIHFPYLGRLCVGDLELAVSGGGGDFSKESRDTRHQVHYLVGSSPAYRIVNTSDRYIIEKEILSDPRRDVMIHYAHFVPVVGRFEDYRMQVTLRSSLSDGGSETTAWAGSYKGIPLLFAGSNGTALAVACSVPWMKRSVGFTGTPGGGEQFLLAHQGDVILSAEIDLAGCGGTFVLALGFGTDHYAAAFQAVASLKDGLSSSEAEYVSEWHAWQKTHPPLRAAVEDEKDLGTISAAILKTLESKQFPGLILEEFPAGPSAGQRPARPPVVTRELAETARGLLAAGAVEDVRRLIRYFQVTQEADGRWPRRMLANGISLHGGEALAETALPVLLADHARRLHVVSDEDVRRQWPMLRAAAGYLVRTGPAGSSERWEEDGGCSPFALAAAVAALLAAAEGADRSGEEGLAVYLRETADTWNDGIERWTAPGGTPAHAYAGSPPGESLRRFVTNEVLALVRFGLRAADDHRITEAIAAVDTVLKVDTPSGPLWRSSEDPAESREERTGKSLPSTVVAAQRALFELAAGRRDRAEQLMRTMEDFAHEGGMLPAYVWDEPDVPGEGLYYGRSTGGRTPSARAHAEYLVLRRSLDEDKPFDLPPQAAKRYLVERMRSSFGIWRFGSKARAIEPEKVLRIELLAPAVIHWSADGWRTIHDTATRSSGAGTHLADITARDYAAGTAIEFTFYWSDAGRWEGRDFAVYVGGAVAGRVPELAGV